GVELELYPYALIARSNERKRARLLDQLARILNAPLRLAAAHEIAQPFYDLPCAQSLLGGFFHRIAQERSRALGALFQETARALPVIRYGGERLVQLMCKRRGHFAHRGQP